MIWMAILVGTAVLGILLRLDGIGSSLWLDEFGTLWVVEDSLSTAWGRAITFQGQTPFYYTFAWLARQILGESEIALRIPSVIFGLATWTALSAGAWKLFGRRAGESAFILAAIDPTLVHASADARPYGLAFLLLTLTVVGFIGSCLTGRRSARALWITAGAGTMWAHYVFYPFVLGIFGAYWTARHLERRYSPGQLGRDLILHFLLVSLAAPQLVHLLGRRETLDWVSTGYTGGGLIYMTMPYWLALVMGALAARKRDEPMRSIIGSLWTCLLLGSLAFVALMIIGTNILHWRYMQGALIVMLLLAAGAVAVLNRYRGAVCMLVTILLLATILRLNHRIYGTVTQLGFEKWRQATQVLEDELRGDTLTPVLYRSGFIEEDQLPLGSPVPATRAPLRSPGSEMPDWNIIPLTATWELPEREAYFANEILDWLDSTDDLYLLSRSGRYASSVVDWIEDARPGSFTSHRRDFGQVVLVIFRRVQAPQE
jgi:hypothetical protein